MGIAIMRTTTNIPLQVNRNGKKRIIEVRRLANEELLHAALLKGGAIRLRVAIQIGDRKGKYWGYQGSASFRDVRSIKEAREFEKAMRKFVEGD